MLNTGERKHYRPTQRLFPAMESIPSLWYKIAPHSQTLSLGWGHVNCVFFGLLVGWVDVFSFLGVWLDDAAPDWYYVSCVLWDGIEWQDRKAAPGGFTVNAHRIMKTCEWPWIIASQAHLDMHRGGNLLWDEKCISKEKQMHILSTNEEIWVFVAFLSPSGALTVFVWSLMLFVENLQVVTEFVFGWCKQWELWR